MAEDAVAYVSIVPSFQGGGKQIESQIDGAGVGKNIGSSVAGGFLSTVGAIGLGIVKVVGGAVTISGGLIAGLALKGGISRALDIQDAQAKLVGLGHSAADITEIMADALGSVQGTAFGLDKAATVAASAVAAGIQPGKDLTQYLTNVADASTIAGVSLESMGNIFNTVQAGNKAYNEQLEQLSQQGIPIYQYLAKELGVTAGAVFDLASSGEISSAEFGKAIQDNIGGAALSSGKTARGAWANVEAALSRLGAAFTGPAIAAAPALFVAVEGAVDRANTALTPYIGSINARLVPAMASLTSWLGKVDFSKMILGLKGIYKLVVGGRFSTQLADAFHIKMDSGLVTFFYDVHQGIMGIVDGIKTGDWSGFSANLATIGSVVKPLGPIFIAVFKGISNIADSVGKLITAGIGLLPPIINVFAGALGFLKDNSGLVLPLIIAIGAAMLIYKTAQVAANIAALAMIPAYTARTAVLLAAIPATLANAAANGVSTAAVEGNTGSLIVATAAWIGARVATVAGAVATGVATAAQWLFNAALDANPIGIVVLAIAALVAGLIWFFTQTKLGKQIWADFTSFVSSAVGNIASVTGKVFASIGSIIKGGFDGVVSFVKGIFNTVSDVVNHIIDGINAATGVAGVIGIHVGKIPHLPHLAEGGIVSHGGGGIQAVIGEGRYDEAVVPLTPQFKKSMASAGDTQKSGGNVYVEKIVAPDQDPRVSGRIMGREFTKALAGTI